jgi:hypothetical protein
MRGTVDLIRIPRKQLRVNAPARIAG